MHLRDLLESLILRDGRIVSCGLDREGNWVAVQAEGLSDEVVRLPRWTGGVGGMELSASPDEKYLALFIYSGQSSQGYELLALRPKLERIGGLAEGFGHGTAPVFSPGGSCLATWISREIRVRESGEYFEDMQDPDSDLEVVVDWSRLYVQPLPGSAIQSFPVGVAIPLSADLDEVSEWDTYDAIEFVAEDELTLQMPWGETLRVSLPAPAAITAEGPRT
jgi:hypothetical protein